MKNVKLAMKNPGLKKVRLSVTDFALPAPQTGSIDSNSGFGRGSQAGIEIHQRIQAEKLRLDLGRRSGRDLA